MQDKTVVKILKRYIKGLECMAEESRIEGDVADRSHYIMDKNALEYALRCVEERRDTRS